MCFFTFVTSQLFAKAYIVVVINIYVRDKVLKKPNKLVSTIATYTEEDTETEKKFKEEKIAKIYSKI